MGQTMGQWDALWDNGITGSQDKPWDYRTTGQQDNETTG